MALSTSTNGNIASQTNTQSPQASAGSNNSAAPSSRVQPGTASSLLTKGGGQGVPLTGTQLSVVSLNTSPQAIHSTLSRQPQEQPKHHLNTGLLTVAIGLLLLAIIIFGLTTRSAKNTTI